ncbi:cellulase family glycosylhydrolase [Nocardiopsis baichengensis]|uniref:cellulase family glycosylhydrolase n=1 Tax=Nocardiopsis baichengensis TaxID=280240 RepID=UPI000347476F|nr:cellulase family glycosylhydrolase [Nocardiopsis baichengensis]
MSRTTRTRRPVLRAVAVAAVLVTAAAGVAAVTRTEPGPPRYITDDQGRALFLHGFNTSGSTKADPDSLPWITEEDVQHEYDTMGTNFVRLLIQWSAVEPEPGEYDEAYLDAVAERVDWYGERGYHVLLDMHQDLYGADVSPDRHSGNGAPAWATRTDGLPVAEQDMWELVYLEPGTMRAFDHFWNTTGDHPELMEHYADAWGRVAERFADDPAVIGYDLMNEPFGGSLQGPAFERGPLAELYRRCTERIRGADTDTWIFVEGQAVGVNWGTPSALPRLDDPRPGEPRIVYAPHAYPLPMDLGRSYTGEGRGQVDTAIALWEENVRVTAERLGAPVVLGEFGLDMSGDGAEAYVAKMLDVTDSMATGRAYWSNDHDGWGPWADEDLTPGPLAEVMDRAYPRAVAGDPLDVGYDPGGTGGGAGGSGGSDSPESPQLTVRFKAVEGVTGPTEVYLPEGEFPDGGEARVAASTGGEAEASVEWDAERRVLAVELASPAPGTEYELRVRPDRP